MKKAIATVISAACLLCCTMAHAIVYKLDFTAKTFIYHFPPYPLAPQNYIKGSIVFTAESLGDQITSIEDIDLVIGGHTYTTSEVSGQIYGAGYYLFGGIANGLNSATSQSDDFMLSASPLTGLFSSFAYTQVGDYFGWSTSDVSVAFTEQNAEVPVPSSLALMLAGFSGIGLLSSRRRRATV